jgi:tRNA modification GTPase
VNLDDTIVAIATPAGRGGIGVVRLAGTDARQIALPMLRLKHALEPGRAVFGELIEPETAQVGTGAPGCPAGPSSVAASRIDEVVVTYFPNPHSYTTDDIIEISAHGSPVVLRHIVELALARGARLAEPGEFTRRAFLNGRIDLTQAEAVKDLIDSQTLYQAKIAAQQLEGALSQRLQPAKQNLINLIATLEAGIDFAEDEISVRPAPQIVERIAAVRAPLDVLAQSFAYGKIVHEGLTLAIVGRPNVGKSSLFNRLVEKERAIVTAAPGTTRDLVSETVAIGGIPVRLVDTAGIRRALDEAESIGIRKSMEALADADLVLVVLDTSQPLAQEDHDLLAQVSDRPAIAVENKCDLGTYHVAADALSAGSGQVFVRPAFSDDHIPHVRTSAVTGDGLAELRAEILRHAGGEAGPQTEPGFLTSVRHQELIKESIAALDTGRIAIVQKVPHEMILMDLYNSLRALDKITGATTTDDILNLIFSTFCIGK